MKGGAIYSKVFILILEKIDKKVRRKVCVNSACEKKSKSENSSQCDTHWK